MTELEEKYLQMTNEIFSALQAKLAATMMEPEEDAQGDARPQMSSTHTAAVLRVDTDERPKIISTTITTRAFNFSS